jgi:hypothetical protein
MHYRKFNLYGGEECHVNFNPDFSGMAVISWGEKSVEVPALVLTLGISDVASRLTSMAMYAENIAERSLGSEKDEFPQCDSCGQHHDPALKDKAPECLPF